MAGAPNVIDKLKKGYEAIGRTYRNPRRLQPAAVPDREGEEEPARRSSSISATTATSWRLRMDNWKVVFMEQRTPGKLDVWRDPFVRLRTHLSCTTSVPTPTSSQRSRRTATTTG